MASHLPNINRPLDPPRTNRSGVLTLNRSNSTANIFLGGARKSWMPPSTGATHHFSTTAHANNNIPHPTPLPLPPPLPVSTSATTGSASASGSPTVVASPASTRSPGMPNFPAPPQQDIAGYTSPYASPTVPVAPSLLATAQNVPPPRAQMPPTSNTPPSLTHSPASRPLPTPSRAEQPTRPAEFLQQLQLQQAAQLQQQSASSLPSPDPTIPPRSHTSPYSPVHAHPASSDPLAATAPRLPPLSTDRASTPTFTPNGFVYHQIGTAPWFMEKKQELELYATQAENSLILSETVETPRAQLLTYACAENDLTYLVLHQIYCLSTFSPADFNSLPGINPKHLEGLHVVRHLLVDNRRVSGDFLKWCVFFPGHCVELLKAPAYLQALRDVQSALVALLDHWKSFEIHVRERGYPPLVNDMVHLLNIKSPVLQFNIFLCLCRRIPGAKVEGKLQEIFTHDLETFKRRVFHPVPEQQRQNEIGQIIASYLSTIAAMKNHPSARTISFSPRLNPGPSRTQQSGNMSQALQQQPPGTVSSLAVATTTPPMTRRELPPGQVRRAPQGQVPQGQVPQGQVPQDQVPQDQVPQGQVPQGQVPQGQVPQGQFTPRQMFQGQVPQGHLIPQQSRSHHHSPLPQRLPYYSLQLSPQNHQQAQQLQQPQQPQYSLQVSHAPHPQYLQQAGPQIARAVQPSFPPAPMPAGHRAPSLNPPHGPPQQHQRGPSLLLPPPGVPPVVNTRPNPNRLAIHQAYLRDPVNRVISQNALGEQETELLPNLTSFAVGPQPLGQLECAFKWQFTLSGIELQNLPIFQSPGQGQRMLRTLVEGKQCYRLRCIKIAQSTTEPSEHSWCVAETAWPSVIYVSINDIEVYPRRRLHNGRDLPLDISRLLQVGTNRVSAHIIRSTAEQKDFTYAIAVEVITFLSFSHAQSLTRFLPAVESRNQICGRLASNPGSNDDELSIVSDDLKITLIDPHTARLSVFPVRGSHCEHQECFDRDTFLQTRAIKSGNQSAIEADWRCPICRQDARPQSLILDGFLAEVRSELERTNRCDGARILQVKADGSWEVKTDDDLASSEKITLRPSRNNSKRKSTASDGMNHVAQRLKTDRSTSMPGGSLNRSPTVVILD